MHPWKEVYDLCDSDKHEVKQFAFASLFIIFDSAMLPTLVTSPFGILFLNGSMIAESLIAKGWSRYILLSQTDRKERRLLPTS